MTKEQIDELAKDYAAEWWRRYEDRLVYRPYQWILRLIAKSMVKAYKKGFNEAKRFYKKRKSYVIMDMDLAGYLATRKKIDGLVTTDAGRDLTDKELRAYCRWGLRNGYTRLKQMPEFETIEKQLKL